MKLQDLRQYDARPPVAPVHKTVGPELHELLSGEIVPIASGRSFCRDERYGPEYTHGADRLIRLTEVSSQRLAVVSKDPELSYVDLRRAVFLDTETTGLGMGAGTYIFLVGAGYLDGNSFRIRQFFLGGPEDEPAYLDTLDGFLREFSVVVTFNGKAFDWPLLEGRYARFRRAMPLTDPPHVDLLHPARRLWKRRLESCALSALESAILGVARSRKDVSGWEIPQRYFTYLRTADAHGLEGVFYHNLQDILSLAALTIRIDRLLLDPLGEIREDGLDYLSVARIFDREGQHDSAILCYEESLRRPLDATSRHEALVRLAGVQKRLRLWDAALATWDRMVDHGGDTAVVALVEMAKYYEHTERDFESALDAVRYAMMLLELRAGPTQVPELREMEHRHSRLVNRLASDRRHPWARVGWAESRR